MSEKSFILSSSGLKNIVDTGNEFIFHFGNCKIQMNNIFAEFLSPIVSRLHQSDPTIDSIHYKTPKNGNSPTYEELFSEEIVQLLKEISRGQQISINKDQSIKLQQISILLCNNELFDSIEKLYPEETKDDKINEYLNKLTLFQNQIIAKIIEEDIDFSSLIDIIASHFYQIDKNQIKSLPKSLLLKILSNTHLKIEDEDTLFEIIKEIFEERENENENKNKEEDEEEEELTIFDFYEQINFSGLSDEKFKEFLEIFDPTKMTNSLWKKLCNRFLNKEINKDRYSGQKFLFKGKESESFQGIIYQLTKECGGNVAEKGILSISSFPEHQSYPSKNAVDFENIQSQVITYGDNNAWLMYDFKEKKVQPTHYSIRSRPSGKGSDHPKNWVIEGSNTGGNDWKILDSQNDVTCLDDKSVFHTFEIKEKYSKDEFYRFLRLRQTGPNSANCYQLCLSALEYFGTIIY